MKLRQALHFQIDRFARSSGALGGSTYTYDANGSITGNGQDTYTYYHSGRLKQVTRGSTNIYALRYNGLGQLVHRTDNNVMYLYGQDPRLLGEYTADGDVIQETVWLGNTPILTLRPDSQLRTADNNGTAATALATITGTWTTATTPQGFYGPNYHSHASTADAPSTDNVLYTITPTATKDFRVYARWVASPSNATNAQYTINTNVAGATPTTITVDQTQNGGTWNYLGTYALNTANNLTVTLNAQGNGTVIADAVRIIPNTATNIQNNTYFVHTDHLNTPRLITNYTNQKRWTWYLEQAEPFGANVPNENPQSLGAFTYNLRFPGQLIDTPSGLVYNYYRDYNPRTGRYIESDPIGLAGGINTYAYVQGNPLSYSDPRGLLVGVVDAVIIVGGGLLITGCIATNCTKPMSDALANAADAASDVVDKAVDAVKEACNPCHEYPSRLEAYLEASAEAGVGIDWIPIGWDQYNKPKSPQDQQLYSKFRQNIGNDPYGYRSPAGGEIVEHPADSHHSCPHFHAKRNLKGISISFPYDPEK